MHLKPGQVVDRYIVDATLARGTFADLYRVRHTLLHSVHCIKHLRDSDPSIRAAFVEEGRVQALLDHSNVVNVTDMLELDRRPALVMQFVGDGDLGDWIERYEHPPVLEAIELFRGLVRGVYAAHRAGYVHRDIKPENVLVRKEAGRLIPKLSDFGLAKRMRKDGRAQTLSAEFRLIGTPEYMAPEQIRMPGDVDPRADLYSLGVVLYELLTGAVPFDGDDPESVISLVMRGAYRNIDELRPDLPAVVGTCIDRLLAPQPSHRISDCRTLLQLLDRVR